MRLALLALLLVASACRTAPRVDEGLRAELLERVAEDQEVREALGAKYASGEPLEAADAAWIERVDHANTERIQAIVAEHGWPGQRLVGADGARAAFLLVQHADADPAFQRRALALLEAAVAADDAEPQHLAYLTDRVRVAAGEPQLYGTQMTVVAGRLEPHPIEDEAHVDARRATVGLGPLAEYVARMRAND